MLNFEKICRTCLTESSALLSIYDGDLPHPNDIAGLLSSFTNISARQGDCLPGNVCSECCTEINRAVSFKQKCERSEHTLQIYIQQHKFVKNEMHDEIDGINYELQMPDAKYNFIESTEEIGDLRDVLITGSLGAEDRDDKEGVIKYNLDVISDNSFENDGVTIQAVSYESTGFNEDSSQDGSVKKVEINPPLIITKKVILSPFKCDKCNGTFATKKSLGIHVRYNKCVEKSYECHICKRVFISRRTLTLHMPTHLDKRFQCDRCDRQFTRKERLKMHLKDHSNDRKHQCPHCPKGFNMIGTLKDHLRTHNGERPYLCSICGKGFSQSTNLRQHMMRHSKTKPHKCTVCNNTFVSKGELSAHMRKHTGDHPFVCDLCGTGFTTSSSMVKHRRIHTGERPYACDYCPMRFTALGTLKNHRRTHTGERPFACKYCERRFAQRSDCMSHQRIHTDERKYVCTACGKAFLSGSTLKQHVAKLHPPSVTEPIVQPTNVS